MKQFYIFNMRAYLNEIKRCSRCDSSCKYNIVNFLKLTSICFNYCSKFFGRSVINLTNETNIRKRFLILYQFDWPKHLMSTKQLEKLHFRIRT